MRNLCLVGMAPPAEKQAVGPFPAGLDEHLVPLDPRHGVFPNLVASPLLATLVAMQHDPSQRDEFLVQVSELVAARSLRRFNVFESASDDVYRLSPETRARFASMDPRTELWAVFGHASVGGLLALLAGHQPGVLIRGKDLEERVEEFLESAGQVHDSKCAEEGALHELFSRDTNGKLRGAVAALLGDCPTPDIDAATAKLRAIVPVLHNEAWQSTPIGKNQNHFVLGRKPQTNDEPQLFLTKVGETLSRLLTEQIDDAREVVRVAGAAGARSA